MLIAPEQPNKATTIRTDIKSNVSGAAVGPAALQNYDAAQFKIWRFRTPSKP